MYVESKLDGNIAAEGGGSKCWKVRPHPDLLVHVERDEVYSNMTTAESKSLQAVCQQPDIRRRQDLRKGKRKIGATFRLGHLPDTPEIFRLSYFRCGIICHIYRV